MVSSQNNEGGVHLFSPYVWKYTYDFPLDILQKPIDEVFDAVKHNSALEKGNAISTVTNPEYQSPHTWEELAEFQGWLGHKLTLIKEELNAWTSTVRTKTAEVLSLLLAFLIVSSTTNFFVIATVSSSGNLNVNSINSAPENPM